MSVIKVWYVEVILVKKSSHAWGMGSVYYWKFAPALQTYKLSCAVDVDKY